MLFQPPSGVSVSPVASLKYSPLILRCPTISWALLAEYWICYENVNLGSSIGSQVFYRVLGLNYLSFNTLTYDDQFQFYAWPGLGRGNPTIFSSSAWHVSVFSMLAVITTAISSAYPRKCVLSRFASYCFISRQGNGVYILVKNSASL